MSFPHSLTTFRARFPEFTSTDDAVVSAVLEQARLEVSERVWGVHAGEGQALLAAHKLALTAFGRDARVAQDQRKTIYGVELERLQRVIGTSHRLVLDETLLSTWGIT